MPSIQVLIAKKFNNLQRPLQVHIDRTTVLASELAGIYGVDVDKDSSVIIETKDKKGIENGLSCRIIESIATPRRKGGTRSDKRANRFARKPTRKLRILDTP